MASNQDSVASVSLGEFYALIEGMQKLYKINRSEAIRRMLGDWAVDHPTEAKQAMALIEPTRVVE